MGSPGSSACRQLFLATTSPALSLLLFQGCEALGTWWLSALKWRQRPRPDLWTPRGEDGPRAGGGQRAARAGRGAAGLAGWAPEPDEPGASSSFRELEWLQPRTFQLNPWPSEQRLWYGGA